MMILKVTLFFEKHKSDIRKTSNSYHIDVIIIIIIILTCLHKRGRKKFKLVTFASWNMVLNWLSYLSKTYHNDAI
jgi:hypothetical protein